MGSSVDEENLSVDLDLPLPASEVALAVCCELGLPARAVARGEYCYHSAQPDAIDAASQPLPRFTPDS